MRLARTAIAIVAIGGLATGLQALSVLDASLTPGSPCPAAQVNRSVNTAKGWLGCVRPSSALELNVGGLTPAEKQAVTISR